MAEYQPQFYDLLMTYSHSQELKYLTVFRSKFVSITLGTYTVFAKQQPRANSEPASANPVFF